MRSQHSKLDKVEFKYVNGKWDFHIGANAQAARTWAVSNGGGPLRGSIKQQNWAEKIRMNKFRSLTDEAQKLALFLKMCEKARFWIENKDKDPELLSKQIEKSAELIKEMNELLHQEEREFAINKQSKLFDELHSKRMNKVKEFELLNNVKI
jgi:hypothetical protein